MSEMADVVYTECRICRLKEKSRDRRLHVVYGRLSYMPESYMPDTTVYVMRSECCSVGILLFLVSVFMSGLMQCRGKSSWLFILRKIRDVYYVNMMFSTIFCHDPVM